MLSDWVIERGACLTYGIYRKRTLIYDPPSY